MSRAAVLEHLRSDELLKAFAPGGIHPNYALEKAPSNRATFIILRWGNQVLRGRNGRGPRALEVWAHTPQDISTDYGEIDNALVRVRHILTNMEDIPGADGFTVTSVGFAGEGPDLTDPGYSTITRNSAFEVLYRSTS